MPPSSTYVCDTLPAPRLLVELPDPPPSTSRVLESSKQFTPRKLCVRHQRMADEGTNLKLQQVSLQIILFHFLLTYCATVTRCFAPRRTRSSQCSLVQLLFSFTSSPSLDSSRSLDHVLFLSVISPLRATRTPNPYRSFCHPTPRNLFQNLGVPRRHIPLPCSSGQSEVEMPG